MKLPLFTSLRGYDTGWLRGDVVAGLTVWAVLVVGPMSATAALSAAAAAVADVAMPDSAGFFANADTVRAHPAEPGARAVVLDAETAPFIDVGVARMLVQVTDDLRRADTAATLPPAYPSVQAAVEALSDGPRPRDPQSPGPR